MCLAAALVAQFSATFGLAPAAGAQNLTRLAQPSEAPARLLAVVEIPEGSRIKYEVDAATGVMAVDRFLDTPVRFPANYGFLPSLIAPDGDPVDVLVITRHSVMPGAVIEVRPIGLLNMNDGDEADDKIIAVPAAGVDSFFDEVDGIERLSRARREEIEAFFRTYKTSDPADNPVTTNGFGGAPAARQAVRELMQGTGPDTE